MQINCCCTNLISFIFMLNIDMDKSKTLFKISIYASAYLLIIFLLKDFTFETAPPMILFFILQEMLQKPTAFIIFLLESCVQWRPHFIMLDLCDHSRLPSHFAISFTILASFISTPNKVHGLWPFGAFDVDRWFTEKVLGRP